MMAVDEDRIYRARRLVQRAHDNETSMPVGGWVHLVTDLLDEIDRLNHILKGVQWAQHNPPGTVHPDIPDEYLTVAEYRKTLDEGFSTGENGEELDSDTDTAYDRETIERLGSESLKKHHPMLYADIMGANSVNDRIGVIPDPNNVYRGENGYWHRRNNGTPHGPHDTPQDAYQCMVEDERQIRTLLGSDKWAIDGLTEEESAGFMDAIQNTRPKTPAEHTTEHPVAPVDGSAPTTGQYLPNQHTPDPQR